jgi:hypothetical protein
VDWPAAETYLAALDADARRTLLGILTSPSEVRADAIGACMPVMTARTWRNY